MKSNNIHIRAISQQMPQPAITKIYLKMTYLKLHSNFPGADELSQWFMLRPYLSIVTVLRWWFQRGSCRLLMSCWARPYTAWYATSHHTPPSSDGGTASGCSPCSPAERSERKLEHRSSQLRPELGWIREKNYSITHWSLGDLDMGKFTEVRLSCYLALLSADSKTR